MPGPAAGIIGSVIGGVVQAGAAKRAAKAQERSANQDIAFQRETRDIVRNDFAPYREGGYVAQQALDFELGLGNRPKIGGGMPAIEEFTEPANNNMNSLRPGNMGPNSGLAGVAGLVRGVPPKGATRFRVNGQTFSTRAEAETYAKANQTGGTEYGGYTKTPGYDFRLAEGQRSIEASAAARGGLNSGATMVDLLKYGQDYGSNEYGNYLSRLGGRADAGMAAAGMSGQASQAAAGNISTALGNRGNAQAAGAIGVGNAITGGIQNALGAWNYQKNLTNAANMEPWRR